MATALLGYFLAALVEIVQIILVLFWALVVVFVLLSIPLWVRYRYTERQRRGAVRPSGEMVEVVLRCAHGKLTRGTLPEEDIPHSPMGASQTLLLRHFAAQTGYCVEISPRPRIWVPYALEPKVRKALVTACKN